MDPVITNGIDAALLRVVERRAQERDCDPAPRRKRPAVPEQAVEEAAEETGQEPGPETPKHALDDLA